MNQSKLSPELHARFFHFRTDFRKDGIEWPSSENMEFVLRCINDALAKKQIRFYYYGGVSRLALRFKAITVCSIEDEKRNTVAKGYSFCSQLDQFSRPRGRSLSFSRAREVLRKNGDAS